MFGNLRGLSYKTSLVLNNVEEKSRANGGDVFGNINGFLVAMMFILKLLPCNCYNVTSFMDIKITISHNFKNNWYHYVSNK